MTLKTESVSPLSLQMGDRVFHHGAIVEVAHIIESYDRGEKVVACLSRLVGDDTGSIPRGWFDTLETLKRCNVGIENLPDGLYWNIQGNKIARFLKII